MESGKSRAHGWLKDRNKIAGTSVPAFEEKLAATYSRGVYKTTTIGNAAFDGRVRNGIGSDHSFKATKNRNNVDTSDRYNVFKDQSAPWRGNRLDPAFL